MSNLDTDQPSIWRRAKSAARQVPTWGRLLAAGVLIVGVFVAGVGTATANQQPIIDNLASQLAAKSREVGNAEVAQQVAESKLKSAQVKAASDKVTADKAHADLAARESAVAAAEAAVTARESAVGTAEQQKSASQVKNGVHVIGTTVEPGVYSTEGPNGGNSVGCYYAWKSGTGSDADIVDNNIVTGAATVTLSAGEVFESSYCKPWSKVG